MQSTLLKQVAYNQRVMEAEDGIAGINCDVTHFLAEMSTEERVTVCVDSSEEMKRNEEAIAGQLWIQGDRQMTAYNRVPDSMANTQESAILAAAAEAVSWRHALELDGPRKSQRVVIYPKEVSQLEEVLSAGDPNIDSADGHSVAYEIILQKSQEFANPPIFLNEENARSVDDPYIAQNVSEWMAVTKQLATGNRRCVLEDGADKMNSSDEDDPDMKPDVLTGMYTSEMDPEKGPIQLSQSQVAAQKAAAHALKASKSLPASQKRYLLPIVNRHPCHLTRTIRVK
jgi:hypothetical protein